MKIRGAYLDVFNLNTTKNETVCDCSTMHRNTLHLRLKFFIVGLLIHELYTKNNLPTISNSKLTNIEEEMYGCLVFFFYPDGIH